MHAAAFGAEGSPDIKIDSARLLDIVWLGERLHRQFLEGLQFELDRLRVRDINNVRALMLLNIGDARMTVSELLLRGCYQGSNVSYNLRKLTEAGYVIQERSARDKRVIMVHISPKATELCGMLQHMNARHEDALAKDNFKTEDLITCREVLRTLQLIWSEVDRAGSVTQQSPRSAGVASTNSGNESAPP